jgi:deoxyribonuclease-4
MEENKNKVDYLEIGYIKWVTGAHIGFLGNLHDTVEKSVYYGMDTMQFFFGSPKSFRRHQAKEEDIKMAVELCKKWPMHVFSHFPYVANLAGSSTTKTLAWSGSEIQDRKTQIVIDNLGYELGVLSNFNIKTNGVVVHPGCFPDREKGLVAISESISRIKFTEGSTLLLENAAGEGNKLAVTFEEIKEIYDKVVPEKQKYLGVCVDTAHIFGYGSYDLSKCSGVQQMFDDFDMIIGLDKFKLLHLNDSKVKLGSKMDRHELLGDGCIWGQSFESLLLLLNLCEKHGIPAVLETHGSDMLTLSRLSMHD